MLCSRIFLLFKREYISYFISQFGKAVFKDEEVEEVIKNEDYVNWNFEINEESNSLEENNLKNEYNLDKLRDNLDHPSKDKNQKAITHNGKKEELSKKNIQENFKNMFDEEA